MNTLEFVYYWTLCTYRAFASSKFNQIVKALGLTLLVILEILKQDEAAN